MPDLSDKDRQYLDGLLRYYNELLDSQGMSFEAYEQAALHEISRSDRFRGQDARDIFYSWMEEPHAR